MLKTHPPHFQIWRVSQLLLIVYNLVEVPLSMAFFPQISRDTMTEKVFKVGGLSSFRALFYGFLSNSYIRF